MVKELLGGSENGGGLDLLDREFSEADKPDREWLYRTGISRVEGVQGEALMALYVDNWYYINRAPGSSRNHQAWEGGYKDHIMQFNRFVEEEFDRMVSDGIIANLPLGEQFTLSDALVVGALHDIEKPFAYGFDSNGEIIKYPGLVTKDQKKTFRDDLIEYYGIELTPTQQNAMICVEGIPANLYTPDSRVMEPLAALVHMADIFSARICYNLHS